MDGANRILNPHLRSKVMSAAEAALLIPSGANVGMSGFTGAGYPKALPQAIASHAKAEHAAEDFNKIRTADLVISINATEEEMAKGEARMFFAASRNQKGEFAIRIKRDLSRGHAIKEVIGFE